MEKSAAWLIIYSAIVSLNEHPGTGRGDSLKRTPSEVADLTDQYFKEYLCRGQWLAQLQSEQ